MDWFNALPQRWRDIVARSGKTFVQSFVAQGVAMFVVTCGTGVAAIVAACGTLPSAKQAAYTILVSALSAAASATWNYLKPSPDSQVRSALEAEVRDLRARLGIVD